MYRIVPTIESLEQHCQTLITNPAAYRPTCGLGKLWCHGHYERKADRGSGVFNPVFAIAYEVLAATRDELLSTARDAAVFNCAYTAARGEGRVPELRCCDCNQCKPVARKRQREATQRHCASLECSTLTDFKSQVGRSIRPLLW